MIVKATTRTLSDIIHRLWEERTRTGSPCRKFRMKKCAQYGNPGCYATQLVKMADDELSYRVTRQLHGLRAPIDFVHRKVL